MRESERVHPEPQPLSPSETAGKILASARVGWDLSVEEVAENLNLSVDTIRALEADEYDKLPGSTFVKGYIRSYAGLLRLNPDEVLQTVDLVPEKIQDIPGSREAVRLRPNTSRPKKKKSRSRGGAFFRGLLYFVLFVALVIFGLNQWSRLDTTRIAEIFKLPAATEQPAGEGNGEAGGDAGDGSKGALIRIE